MLPCPTGPPCALQNQLRPCKDPALVLPISNGLLSPGCHVSLWPRPSGTGTAGMAGGRSVSCHPTSGARGGGRGGIPGQGRGTPHHAARGGGAAGTLLRQLPPQPRHRHPLPCPELQANPAAAAREGPPPCAGGCRVAQQHVPPAPVVLPLWGALSGAGTPDPAPAAVGGSGSTLWPQPAEPLHATKALVLAHSRTGLMRQQALPRVSPPQGGVHPKGGVRPSCWAGSPQPPESLGSSGPALP